MKRRYRADIKIKWRDDKRRKVVGRVACDSISRCVSRAVPVIWITWWSVPLPFLIAGVPPVGGGDVNRDWEG